jgi:peptide deformylase
MSETLIIDTGAGLTKNAPKIIEPLSLYDENHPMLRMKIPEFNGSLPDPEITELAARLKMTMKLYGGVGLSANQCGVYERMFVIGTDQFQMVCINPKIIEKEGEVIKGNEGCLSFPGLFLKIDRPESIVAEWSTENGEVKRARLSGITSRCFQHELDHLNGIKFIEHVKPVALKMARQKQDKVIKKHIRNSKKK